MYIFYKCVLWVLCGIAVQLNMYGFILNEIPSFNTRQPSCMYLMKRRCAWWFVVYTHTVVSNIHFKSLFYNSTSLFDILIFSSKTTCLWSFVAISDETYQKFISKIQTYFNTVIQTGWNKVELRWVKTISQDKVTMVLLRVCLARCMTKWLQTIGFISSPA